MRDSEIIEELKKGNRKVFRELYQYFPMVKSMVCKNKGSEDDAKDIFQNAIIVFYKKCLDPEFKLTCKISTYLYAVSEKSWLKVITRKKTVPLEDRVNFDERLSVEQQHDLDPKKDLIMLVNDLLDKIGEPCKSILLLFEYQKLSMTEVASKLGYANGHTARQQKYKCIQKLKKMIPPGVNV